MFLLMCRKKGACNKECIQFLSEHRPLCRRCHSQLSKNGFRDRIAYTLSIDTIQPVDYKLPRWKCPHCHCRDHALPCCLLYRKRHAANIYEYVYKRPNDKIDLPLNESMIRAMKREVMSVRNRFVQRYGDWQADVLCSQDGWLHQMIYLNQLFLQMPSKSLEQSQTLWYYHEKD